MQNARNTLRQPELAFSLSIDNLNWLSKVRDKTVTHRNSMMAAVAGNFYLLDAKVKYDEQQPLCSDTLFEKLFGQDFPRPTGEPRPVITLTADGTPEAMSQQRRNGAREAFMRGPKPKPSAFLVDEEDQQHLLQCTLVNSVRAWIEQHPECADFATRIPCPPQVYPLVPAKTKVLPLPVLDEDEGSIGGMLNVIEAILDELKLGEGWLEAHFLPAVGDAFTANLQRKAMERRADDFTRTPVKDQLLFLHPWVAIFHLQMAYLKYVIETHDLVTGNIDFHDADAFTHVLFSAMVEARITIALRRRGHGVGQGGNDIDDADETLPGDAGDISGATAVQEEDAADSGDDLMDIDEGEDAAQATQRRDIARAPDREETLAVPDDGKRNIRRPDREFADLEWDDFHAVASDEIRGLIAGSIASACRASSSDECDLVFAHAAALFRDLAVFIELRHSTKHGDPGRILAMVRQALPLFQSNGQHRYVSESLELLVDSRYELPGAHKQSMLAASLVNHHGRQDTFLAADLDIEHIVNDLNNVFPVQAKAGGLDRQRKIGELLPLYRACKTKLFRLFFISSLDAKHTTRDRSFTCQKLSSLLIEYGLIERQEKHRRSPVFQLPVLEKRPARSTRTKHVASDSVITGAVALVGTSSKPGAIDLFMARKLRQQGDTQLPDERLQEDTAGEEGISIQLDMQYDAGDFQFLESDLC
ncbi:hypothetical protein V8E36_001912 [Tilletia maclaganii]